MMGSDTMFHNTHGGVFKFADAAFYQIQTYVQNDHKKPEAGGLLLGRFIMDTADVVVDQVTVPMQGDRRSRRRFYREAKNHQNIIDRRWKESRHRCNYLGGWHTHAEPDPSPSRIDTTDWIDALQRNQFDGETLYFIIVGTHEIRAWEGNRLTLSITELKPATNEEA